MFNHNLIELPKLIRIDGEKRHYMTPTGEKYPSVTTVLDATSDKSHLYKWRKRVGEDEANRISNRATTRGTAVHKLCESLVLNEVVDTSKAMPLNIMMYEQLKKFLTANVDDIRISEGSLFSHKLKVAGSVDLVASYKGQPAIIDFKTSTKLKRREWIENYFCQATMYSWMLWEMTKVYHPKIVIAIAVEEEIEPQIFEGDVHDYLPKVRNICAAYHAIV